MPANEDVLTNASYLLDITNVGQAVFKSCGGIGSEHDVIEDRQTGPDGKAVVKKIPGQFKWSDITFSRGLTSDMAIAKWRQMVEEGDVKGARANGSIVLYNSMGEETARWNFVNAWPSSMKLGDLDATASEMAVEDVTITHEGITRVT